MGIWDNRIAVTILHCLEPGVHDKLYIGRVDVMENGRETIYQATCSYGASTQMRLSDHLKGRHGDFTSAAQEVQQMIDSKIKKGYVDIEDPGYRDGLSWSHCIQKVDISMTVGGVNGSTSNRSSASVKSKVRQSQPVDPPARPIVRPHRTITV
jgi:hypothetical protein